MRMLAVIAFIFRLGLVAQAQEPQPQAGHEHADHAVQGGGTLPAGWSARVDGQADRANVKVVNVGSGMHVTLGPAVILFQQKSAGTGPFHTLATFTQTKKTEHAEGYGLFAGGRGLDGPRQAYLYFLVRQDGRFLIKRRDGEQTSDVTKGWVDHPAVHQPDATGASTNLLEIDHKRDPSTVVFLVNRKPVFTADAKTMNLDGIVGLRVNHNLDVHVEGFDIHR
jgi:hypothetical protein